MLIAGVLTTSDGNLGGAGVGAPSWSESYILVFFAGRSSVSASMHFHTHAHDLSCLMR